MRSHRLFSICALSQTAENRLAALPGRTAREPAKRRWEGTEGGPAAALNIKRKPAGARSRLTGAHAAPFPATPRRISGGQCARQSDATRGGGRHGPSDSAHRHRGGRGHLSSRQGEGRPPRADGWRHIRGGVPFTHYLAPERPLDVNARASPRAWKGLKASVSRAPCTRRACQTELQGDPAKPN
jgi:hypothetical protein